MTDNVDLYGTFHIKNGHVEACDSKCTTGTHWTTLNHALHSLSKGDNGEGELQVKHPPESTNAYRPHWDTDTSLPTTGLPLATSEPSVVNRVYEVDRASFDVGDERFHWLWLALASKDTKKIRFSTECVMDWSYGRYDRTQHPLAYLDNGKVIVNGKLQRLAADMYCSGWAEIQDIIEKRWIIPSLEHGRKQDRKKSVLVQLGNPLAYLEATRMAILAVQDAFTGAAIQELQDTAHGLIREDSDTYGDVSLVREYLDKNRAASKYDPLNPISDDERERIESRLYRFLRESYTNHPVIESSANATSLALAYGYSPYVPVSDVVEAVMVEDRILHGDKKISPAYLAAAWKLASSVWSGPGGPSGDYDDPFEADDDRVYDFSHSPTFELALSWLQTAYSMPQVRDWIAAIPRDTLEPERVFPMTGKIDRLHRLIHPTVDRYPDLPSFIGVPRASIIDDGKYFDDYSTATDHLYQDMPSLTAPYESSSITDRVGKEACWAYKNVY